MKTTQIYKIPEYNFEPFLSRIEKLNRRAAKLDCPPIIVTELGTIDEVRKDKSILRKYEIEVSGEASSYNGWTFIGTVQFLSTDNNGPVSIMRSVPGKEIPVEYRERGNVCDHCKSNRYRTETFVVRHDSGEYKQVGRQCIRDFLGHHDPHDLASAASLIIEASDLACMAEDDEGLFGGSESSGPRRFLLEPYFQWVAGVIRVKGWCSKSKAIETEKQPTCDIAEQLMFRINCRYWDHDDWKFYEKCTPTEADKKLTEDAVEWAKGLLNDSRTYDYKNPSDYLYNIGTIATAGIIEWRTTGYAASIVSSYLREQKRLEELKREAAISHHFGTVKKRGVFTLILDGVKVIDGYRFTSYLHKFHDELGNQAVWFGSNRLDEELIGTNIKVKATVKDHDVYKGVEQTILTRVAVEA